MVLAVLSLALWIVFELSFGDSSFDTTIEQTAMIYMDEAKHIEQAAIAASSIGVFIMGIVMWFISKKSFSIIDFSLLYVIGIALQGVVMTYLSKMLPKQRPLTASLCDSLTNCRIFYNEKDVKTLFRSFPSLGASTMATAAAFFSRLISLSLGESKRYASIIKTIMFTAVLMLGGQLLKLGWNAVEDIAAGYFIGLVIGGTCAKGVNKVEAKENNDGEISAAALLQIKD